MNIPDNFLGNKRLSGFNYEDNKNRKEKNQEIYKQKLKQKKKQRKKENKKSNKKNQSNSKEYLLKLINSESLKNKNKTFKLEYQILDEEENNNNKIINNASNKININDKNTEISQEMQEVLDKFEKTIEYQQKKIDSLTKEKIDQTQNKNQKHEKASENDDSSSENDDSKILEKVSRKKTKKKKKEEVNHSLAELKSKAPYPEVVEPWDTKAVDPELLIHFKFMPNTVPFPIHWAQNGKYLQSQRGKVRKPYALPDYIEATGISRIRLIELPVHITLQKQEGGCVQN